MEFLDDKMNALESLKNENTSSSSPFPQYN